MTIASTIERVLPATTPRTRRRLLWAGLLVVGWTWWVGVISRSETAALSAGWLLIWLVQTEWETIAQELRQWIQDGTILVGTGIMVLVFASPLYQSLTPEEVVQETAAGYLVATTVGSIFYALVPMVVWYAYVVVHEWWSIRGQTPEERVLGDDWNP